MQPEKDKWLFSSNSTGKLILVQERDRRVAEVRLSYCRTHIIAEINYITLQNLRLLGIYDSCQARRNASKCWLTLSDRHQVVSEVSLIPFTCLCL